MSDLVKRLRIKAGMIEMGELIAWGSDVALMREAADALEMAAPAVQGEPVARVKTVGGYPDESEHVAEWLCKHKDLKDGDYLYLVQQPAQEIGEVVVTKDKLGNIVSVTRQDAEGRVLSVIAESDVISQSGVLAEGYFHPLPDESDYEFRDAEQFPDGSNCPACVPAVIVRKSAVTNQPAPDVAGLVEALEYAIETLDDCDMNLFHNVIEVGSAALAAYRKQGGGV